MLIIKQRFVDEGKVQCCICPHFCCLSQYQIGRCKVRVNIDGEISSINYSHLSNISIEPIEKKPFLHILKGTKTLSIGSWGCNLDCKFCESTCISQKKPNSTKIINSYEIPEMVKKYSCDSVCFTYNEPIISLEYLIDVLAQCSKEGIKVLLKTNAYVNKSIWDYLMERVYAVNIDFKGDCANFINVTGTDDYVLRDRIIEAINSPCHVEISIPLYYKDIPEMSFSIESLADLLYKHGNHIPCHLLRVNPSYKFIDRESTSNAMINEARNILKAFGIKNIHIFQF